MSTHPVTEMDEVFIAQFPECHWKHSVWLIRDEGGVFGVVYQQPRGFLECVCRDGRERERTRWDDNPAPVCRHERELVEYLNSLNSSEPRAKASILPGFVDGEF